MELAYSGLHQLCAPMLDHLDGLPVPQRDALATVFGLSARPAPDRFLVGLGVLTLFAEVAEHQPLVCIVDDAQWLDHASAQVLGFVARRLHAERIAIRARGAAGQFQRSPRRATRAGDRRARRGRRPHALAEPRARPARCRHPRPDRDREPRQPVGADRAAADVDDSAELAGGFGFPASQPVAGKIEKSFVQRLLELPVDTRLLMVAAAAEPLGDPVLLLRGAEWPSAAWRPSSPPLGLV